MKNILFTLGVSAIPVVAFAQVTDISSLIGLFLAIIQQLVVLVIGLALLTFLWGIARFIMSAGNKDAVEDGRRLMLWGIIGLFVMTSVWGLVGFLENTFFGSGGGSGGTPIDPPITAQEVVRTPRV